MPIQLPIYLPNFSIILPISLEKTLDNADKARKAGVMAKIINDVNLMLEREPDAAFYVKVLDAGGDSKVIY